MNIVMMTNTYKPFVGGVPRSVETFTGEYRRLGHRVLVVAPEFEGAREEEDVIRVPAIQNFHGGDFSVSLPVPGYLADAMQRFGPDLIHSHHPFLLGDTALRVSSGRNVPLVYTNHTLYERYTHYVPGDSESMKEFVIHLVTEYANLCDQVLAPSESVAGLLRDRGVTAPLEVVPTGIDTETFESGDREGFRRELGLEDGDFLVGFVSRIAREKNVVFLAEAVAEFMDGCDRAHFLMMGEGPAEAEVHSIFDERGLSRRVHSLGVVEHRKLVDAYGAMDAFAFASTSETQGIVLVEAMAAGTPVVGLDASGVREVVEDGVNGRLLERRDAAEFAAALEWAYSRPEEEREKLVDGARATAGEYSRENCARKALGVYRRLVDIGGHIDSGSDQWEQARRRLKTEWDLLTSKTRAAGRVLADRFEEYREKYGF